MRKLVTKKLALATNNDKKAKEMGAILSVHNIEVLSTKHFKLPAPEETGNSFLENAKIKALYFAENTGLPALADDSGLCVHALDNRPGIHSARYAETDAKAMQKVIAELADKADRTAHFHCAMVIAWPDGHVESFEAETHGSILSVPVGEHGFGYDPIFVPYGFSFSFAQMEAEAKAALSHRGKAIRAFVKNVVI